MHSALWGIPCAVALSAGLAHAQETPAAPPLKVEIKGARPDARRDDTAATIVVGRDELERHGDRTLADVLKRVPGISIGAAGGRGSDIRMRGLGNGYTQVLLNGTAAPAGFSLESLAPELIERVEVIRTASVELGTQAIAGTVNIILRKQAGRVKQVLKASVEQQDGHSSPLLSTELNGKQQAFDYAVVATLGRTRQPLASTDTETATQDGALTTERITARRELGTADALSLAPRLGGALANGDKLSLQGFLSANRHVTDGDNHETMLTGAPSRYPDSVTRFELRGNLARLDAGWVRALGNGARLDLKLGASRAARTTGFVFDAGARRNIVNSRLDESESGMAAKYALPVTGQHSVTVGLDAKRARRAQSRQGNDMGPPDAPPVLRDDYYAGAITRAALFINDEWTIDPRWSLAAGVRMETLDTAVDDAAAPEVRLRTRITSPVLQTLYKPAEGRQLRIGLTRTYKAPGMGALIPRRYTVDNNNNVTNPDNQGNPDLRPELAWGLDAAYDYYPGKDAMFSASIFQRRITDVTMQQLSQDANGWFLTPRNVGKAVVRGLVLESKFPLALAGAGGAPVQLRMNLTRNWSRVEAIPGPDNRLEGQAPFTVDAGADYRLPGGALSLGGSLNYRRAFNYRYSVPVSVAVASSRGLDLYAAWSLNAQYRLRLSAANLLRKNGLNTTGYTSAHSDQRTGVGMHAWPKLRLMLEREL